MPPDREPRLVHRCARQPSGTLVVDLAGSTPLDPLVRLYRRVGSHPATLAFLGCASPVWNAQRSLTVDVDAGHTLLVQVGTSESTPAGSSSGSGSSG